MKKKLIVIIPLIILVAIGSIVWINMNQTKETKVTDSQKFKEEYESLNGKNIEGKDTNYKSIKIDLENPIEYIDYNKAMDIIKNKSGVIYFGFPECPWCRNALPVLLDSAQEMGIDKIYYFNALSIRDKKSLDAEGNIVVDEEGTEEYKILVKSLYEHLPIYKGLNDETIKRLYFPTVLFVKEGKIVGLHTSTLDSQTDPSVDLTNEQHNELKTIYSEYINDVYEIICDQTC